MKYYIGIDGGGTKTRGVLADENLKVIKSANGLSTNPLAIGFELSAQRLLSIIKKISGNKAVEFCVLGIAGVGRKKHADLLLKTIKRLSARDKFILPPLKILTDLEITFEGAFDGKPGTLLIAGTGSVLFSKNSNNNIIRVGGYGRLIGDEGSGFSIGQKVLASISKSIDGRMPRTQLSDYFLKKFNITDIHSLISLVNSKGFNIAELAKIVLTRAEKKDKECIRILNEEISELILHIRALIKRNKTDKINLSLSGNLLATSNYYSKKLKAEISKQFPGIKIVKAKYPPEIGAVLIAKKFSP